MVDPPKEEILGDGPSLMITAHAMADDANDALAIKVTGEAPNSLRFVAVVRTAEVKY